MGILASCFIRLGISDPDDAGTLLTCGWGGSLLSICGSGECRGNIAAGPESCDSELRARVSINTSLRGISDMVTCDNNHTIHEPS